MFLPDITYICTIFSSFAMAAFTSTLGNADILGLAAVCCLFLEIEQHFFLSYLSSTYEFQGRCCKHYAVETDFSYDCFKEHWYIPFNKEATWLGSHGEFSHLAKWQFGFVQVFKHWVQAAFSLSRASLWFIQTVGPNLNILNSHFMAFSSLASSRGCLGLLPWYHGLERW